MFNSDRTISTRKQRSPIPDLDPEGIVIPIGKGTGLIQIIDSDQPYQVLPLLCPTYFTKEGVL